MKDFSEYLNKCLEHFRELHPENENDNIEFRFFWKTYGSTAGPMGGIGGKALTAFPTLLVRNRINGQYVAYLNGTAKVKDITAKQYEEENP